MRISDWSSYVVSSDLMTDTPTPTPTFRPEIAKRPNVDLPKAVVQASAGSSAPRSEGSPEAKVLLIGRDISLNGKITACDKVIVEGKVEADLPDSRFVEIAEIGRAHVCTPVTNAPIVCRLLLEQKNKLNIA